MVSYTKDLYIQDVEFIYNNILNPRSIKEINKLEESLKRAVAYEDSFEQDTENFTYHLQNIKNIKNDFKERIKCKILNCKATIQVQRNRIKKLEEKLEE